MGVLLFVLKEFDILDIEISKSRLNMDSFENRLYYQKIVFILSAITNHVNYSFYWYRRGPYSLALTADLFDIQELLKTNKFALKKMIKESEQKYVNIDHPIQKMRRLITKFNEIFTQEPTTADIEILASLVFIEKYTFMECKGNRVNTIKEFAERMKYP